VIALVVMPLLDPHQAGNGTHRCRTADVSVAPRTAGCYADTAALLPSYLVSI
jgi:hypothetical protein